MLNVDLYLALLGRVLVDTTWLRANPEKNDEKRNDCRLLDNFAFCVQECYMQAVHRFLHRHCAFMFTFHVGRIQVTNMPCSRWRISKLFHAFVNEAQISSNREFVRRARDQGVKSAALEMGKTKLASPHSQRIFLAQYFGSHVVKVKLEGQQN